MLVTLVNEVCDECSVLIKLIEFSNVFKLWFADVIVKLNAETTIKIN